MVPLLEHCYSVPRADVTVVLEVRKGIDFGAEGPGIEIWPRRMTEKLSLSSPRWVGTCFERIGDGDGQVAREEEMGTTTHMPSPRNSGSILHSLPLYSRQAMGLPFMKCSVAFSFLFVEGVVKRATNHDIAHQTPISNPIETVLHLVP